jgi:hypothetical protein
MIAQLQNLQAFVANHLADVVDWSKHVRPDPNHKTTGDHAWIVIKTPFNGYEMSVRSAYIDPPAGAPVTCRSLGTVTFDDAAGDKHIVGPKADNTWIDISRHIHVRELTDALAAARRELAEAPKEGAGSARVRLAEIAGRAKVWGVKVREDDLRKVEAVAQEHVLDPPASHPQPTTESTGTTADPSAVNDLARDMATSAANWRDDKIISHGAFLGCPVIFITNPGEQISGMGEIPGHCVKILSDDRISIFMTPDHSEPSYRDNLPRRGSLASDGKVHRHNCWDFNPQFERERSRVRHLEEAIAKMADEYNTLFADHAALVERVTVIENAHRTALEDGGKSKRKRGTEEPAKEPDLVG